MWVDFSEGDSINHRLRSHEYLQAADGQRRLIKLTRRLSPLPNTGLTRELASRESSLLKDMRSLGSVLMAWSWNVLTAEGKNDLSASVTRVLCFNSVGPSYSQLSHLALVSGSL